MPEEDYSMWSFWREKYGHVVALTDYYPRLLERRVDLQLAVASIRNGEGIIDSIMECEGRE